MRSKSALVDTSVLVSAFLNVGLTGEVLDRARDGGFQLCVSERILEETRRALLKPKTLRAYGFAKEVAERFCASLRAASVVATDLPAIEPVCRDPDDDHVLAAALAVDAECIVTGDTDLLSLGSYEGIRILSVRTFLDEL